MAEIDLRSLQAHRRPLITTIEWEMLDKRKFYPLSMCSSFTVRCCLYPLTLIRTRLQVQQQNAVYKGTFDAFRKILHHEGIRGFYRGFWISGFQVVSGLCYVSTYESVRHLLHNQGIHNSKTKAMVGGACASMVGQTIIVPFDVISQHLMILGTISGSSSSSSSSASGKSHGKPPDLAVNPLAVRTEGRTKAQVAWDVTRTVYQRDGARGFYRGYVASLCNYVPSSAAWWTFYQLYQDLTRKYCSTVMPHTGVQCVAAILSGCTTSIITNPLDLVRTRVQVQRRTIPETVRYLWATERFNIFNKGLTARMTSSCIYSLAVIFGYETVKKMSVLPEYKQSVIW